VLLREIGRTSISAKGFCVLRCALSHSIQGPQKDVVSSFLEGRLAQILRSSVRASDVIAHTAKCEFTIILPELNEHLARIPLERIRRAAERWNKNSGLQYRMRIKFGLCEYERTTTPQQLLSEVAHRCHVDQFSRTTAHQYIPPAHRLEYTPADDQRPVC
ncbi:MAG TPA: diguanylate cyclase, partial [Terriglobales bacterium]